MSYAYSGKNAETMHRKVFCGETSKRQEKMGRPPKSRVLCSLVNVGDSPKEVIVNFPLELPPNSIVRVVSRYKEFQGRITESFWKILPRKDNKLCRDAIKVYPI